MNMCMYILKSYLYIHVLLQVRNFSQVHPDYGGRIAKLLEQYRTSVSATGFPTVVQ